MSLFLQELSHSPIGVTVCGFFMITGESTVTVLLTVQSIAGFGGCALPNFLYFHTVCRNICLNKTAFGLVPFPFWEILDPPLCCKLPHIFSIDRHIRHIVHLHIINTFVAYITLWFYVTDFGYIPGVCDHLRAVCE